MQQICKRFLFEMIGFTIMQICFNYAWNKMNALQAERSRLWYFAITAVHADRWWKVANCCYQLQWVDCICFGSAVREIICYGTVPNPRSDFSKFVGSAVLLFLDALQLMLYFCLFGWVVVDIYTCQMLHQWCLIYKKVLITKINA